MALAEADPVAAENKTETAPPQAVPKAATPPVTPDREKVDFTKKWIARLMDNMDAIVDQDTRRKLMEACGRSCYVGAHGNASTTPPSAEKVEGFLKYLRDHFGPQCVRMEGNQTLIDFAYVANPRGLKVADGYCLCPLLEDGPAKLSPTYCQCSVGYVREMFTRQVGRPVQVELVRSLRRGDAECRFAVRY